MNIETVLSHAPMIGFIILGLGVNYLLLRYKRKHDLNEWMQRLTRDAGRAATDEDFRRRELAATEAELARYATPETITPVKRNQEVYMQTFPKFIWVVGIAAMVITFMGLFLPRQEGRGNWEIYVGPGLLAVTGLLLLLTEKVRSSYGRVQMLNRKYLLHKAANESEKLLPVMEEILLYYPLVPGLRLEHADQLARANRMDEAIEAVKLAEEMAPNNADLKIVEMSFQLRAGRLAKAEIILKQLWDMPLSLSDPRRELFAAAMDLRRGNEKGAEENLEKAVELDKAFSEKFLSLDQTLSALNAFAGERGIFSGNDEGGEEEAEADGGENDRV
jgi:tetratricopeptide (TPR) repeat protein